MIAFMHTLGEDDNPADPVDALMELSRLMTAVVAHSLAVMERPLTVPQLRVLVLIGSQDSVNVSAVAEALGVNPSNASRTTDNLVRAGLVDRDTSDTDRRNVELTLSGEGERLLKELMDVRRAVFEKVIGRLGEQQRRQLSKAARAFTAAARDLSSAEQLGVDGDQLLHWLV
jgi:DNA-binding MarR family transcriptional regulator